jgi:Leucine-rich repeat (LRR) protein
MTNIQKYLDQNYPKDTRENITKLDLSNQNLEGFLTLEIKEFPNLEEINCSNNQISKISFLVGKTRAAKKQKHE